MSSSLAAWAECVDGRVIGDASIVLTGATTPEVAGPTDIAFLQDSRSAARLVECRAGALVVSVADAELPEVQRFPRIVVADPHQAFVRIVGRIRPLRTSRPGIAHTAVIHSSARLGPQAFVGPSACIGEDVVIGARCQIHAGVVIGAGCQIGDDVVLYPNVVVYPDCRLDDRVIVHANAVIGADGFGYRFTQGRFEKIPQYGTVHLHSDVEIGACTTIDRGAIGATVIGAGTKLDNLVQIAHNCEIGRHNVFAAQVGLAGSCSSGDYVRLGGQVGCKDHLRFNTGCSIGAKSGLHKDVPAGETWIGYPATPEAEQKRLVFSLKRVPEMRDDLKALQKQVAQMAAQLAMMQTEAVAKAA